MLPGVKEGGGDKEDGLSHNSSRISGKRRIACDKIVGASQMASSGLFVAEF